MTGCAGAPDAGWRIGPLIKAMVGAELAVPRLVLWHFLSHRVEAVDVPGADASAADRPCPP